MSKPASNLAFAWQYLKTEKKAFTIAIAFVVLNAGLQTLTPVAIEFLINNAIKVVNYTLLWQVTVGMSLLFLLEAGLFRYQVITVGQAAQRIMYKIRVDLFAHIQKLKTDFFNQNQSGDLISRINSDTTLLDNFLGQYIFAFTSSFFVFIAFGIYLLFLNPTLALIAYFGVFLTILISLALRVIVQQTNKSGLESNGNLKAYLADNLNNYQVIQAYNIHSNLSSEFQSFNLQNQKANFKSRVFTNIFASIYNFTGNLSLLLILTAIFYFKIVTNPLYIGTLVAFIFAVIKFFLPMRELGTVFSSLAEAVAAMTRIREILDEPRSDVFKKEISLENKAMAVNSPLEGWQSQTDGVVKGDATSNFKNETYTNTKTAIQFQNVSFAYPNTEQKVFDNITFAVPTNCKFAIVGPTGEGKSTIAKLMSGLLSQNLGTIKVFDKELKDWNQDEFYNTIGFILQDPFLFSGTVASNIVYGNPRYTEFNKSIIEEEGAVVEKNEKIVVVNSPHEGWQAKPDGVLKSDGINFGDTEAASTNLLQALTEDIKQHQLDSIIPNLQEFLATEVNNNSQNISQGQKQIINFVRVLLREPKILILDEATANLDTITEKYLQQALGKLTNKVTQIVIAHRQNTIQDADYVMQVGGGRVSVEIKNPKATIDN